MAYKNILVGIDGSKRADRAFETAVDLAKVFSAKLYLVWVVNRDRGMDSSFGVNEDFYQDFAKRTKQRLQPYLKKAQDKGADASAEVVIGSIKTIL
ncbi:universal stress protein, partial [Limosilactobacillus mucosae]|nr:universal stress protein [Limosilactobacillus mucosae]